MSKHVPQCLKPPKSHNTKYIKHIIFKTPNTKCALTSQQRFTLINNIADVQPVQNFKNGKY